MEDRQVRLNQVAQNCRRVGSADRLPGWFRHHAATIRGPLQLARGLSDRAIRFLGANDES